MIGFICGVAVAMLILSAFIFILLVPFGKDLVHEIFQEVEDTWAKPMDRKHQATSELLEIYYHRIRNLEEMFRLLGYEDLLEQMDKRDQLLEENLRKAREKGPEDMKGGLSLVGTDPPEQG